MWRGPTLISFLAGFIFPPVWLLTLYLLWQESKQEDRASVTPNLYATQPSHCPTCSHQGGFVGGVIKTVPAMDIRSFRFPISGIAFVCRFTCSNCGTSGRYGLAKDKPEKGWILLGSQMMGY